MSSLEELLNPSTPLGPNQDEWLLKSIDSHLTKPSQSARKGVFYPSALGSICDRYLYNCYHGLVKEEEINATTRRIFDVGDYLGLRYEKYLSGMGILLGTEISLKCEMPPMSGRLDFLIKHPEHGETIIELKSINQRGFTALKEPKPEHIIQTQIYLNIYPKGKEGIVLYENKNNQSIKAFKVTKDEQIWNNIKDRCLRIMNMTEQPKECTGLRYCACKKEDVI